MTTDPSAGVTGYTPETLEAAGFPTISFDGLEVGEEFRSDDRLIRPQDVEAYAFVVEDHDPWFFGPGPFGGPIVHPTLLANQALFMRHTRYVVPAGLHARMVSEYLRPVHLGTRARTTGRVVEKYVRRDKPYMVTAYETADEEGRALVRGRFVQMLLPGSAPPAGTGPRPEPEPPPVDPAIVGVEARAGTIEAGLSLGPLDRTITQRQIDAYSGVRPRSIHTDEDWARHKGFPTTIAQGMMTTAYLSTLMTTTVGEGFVAGGGMDVRFLRPVVCGDTITVTGTVAGFSRHPGDTGDTGDTGDGAEIRIHVEVAAHNDRGEQTMAGTATAAAGIIDGGAER